MSIIPEPPPHIPESMVSLESDPAACACATCPQAATCRIAAGLARLARIRDRMVPTRDNLWLRGRIDEYLGVGVCLAGVFGIGQQALSRPPVIPDDKDGHRSITLEMALRHREALAPNHGPIGLERPKPGDRVEHSLGVTRLP